MRADGKYVSARFKHYGNIVINPLNQTTDNPKLNKTVIPGPASYKVVDEFNQS